jgi:carbamoyl-phosphate synthase large subunit
LGADPKDEYEARLKDPGFEEEIAQKLIKPNQDRLFYLRYAIKKGFSTDKIFELTGIDRWFLQNIKEIIETEDEIRRSDFTPAMMLTAKQYGFSDKHIACLRGSTEAR